MKFATSIKKQIIYLLGIIILVMIMSYQLSLKKTIQLKKEYSDLISEKYNSENLEEKITNLKFNLSQLTGNIVHESGAESKRNAIIDKITKIADSNNVLVTHISPSLVLIDNNYTIETTIIETEGKFINLVSMIYDAEMKKFPGKIVSVNFFSDYDRRTKTKTLFCELFIQSINSI